MSKLREQFSKLEKLGLWVDTTRKTTRKNKVHKSLGVMGFKHMVNMEMDTKHVRPQKQWLETPNVRV